MATGYCVCVYIIYKQRAISCTGFRRRTGAMSYGDRAEIVQKSCNPQLPHGNRTESVRLPYRGRAEMVRCAIVV